MFLLNLSRQLRSGIPLRRITIYTILIAVLYFICWTPYWFVFVVQKVPFMPNIAQVFGSLCDLDECFCGWWSVRIDIGFVAVHHLLCPFAALSWFRLKLDSLRVFLDFKLLIGFNFIFSLLNTQLQMRQHEPTATTLTTNIQPDDNTILNANGGGHCGNYCKVKLIEGGGHHNQMLVNHWTQSGLPNGHITIQNAMKRKSNSSKDDSRWGTDWIIQYSSLKCASIEEQPRHIKSSGK